MTLTVYSSDNPDIAVTADSVKTCKSPVCARITYTERFSRLPDRVSLPDQLEGIF